MALEALQNQRNFYPNESRSMNAIYRWIMVTWINQIFWWYDKENRNERSLAKWNTFCMALISQKKKKWVTIRTSFVWKAHFNRQQKLFAYHANHHCVVMRCSGRNKIYVIILPSTHCLDCYILDPRYVVFDWRQLQTMWYIRTIKLKPISIEPINCKRHLIRIGLFSIVSLKQ